MDWTEEKRIDIQTVKRTNKCTDKVMGATDNETKECTDTIMGWTEEQGQHL